MRAVFATFRTFPCFLLLCSLFASLQTMAQLQANFSIDTPGGCSPLSTGFNNTSTATGSVKWHWDFGNGNTSDLQNPSAVFLEEGVYNVTLTVSKGNETSQLTKTVTVYKKPVVDFNVTPSSLCMPMPASFTGTAVTDGTIASWHWDFGDGKTEQSSSSSVSHIYTYKQSPTVSLTAINNYGCSGTISKVAVLAVKDSLVAGFTADQTVICATQGTVQFTNTSTGPGTLSYSWNFGDGTSSAQASPSHLYSAKGSYPVTLTVSNTEGCSNTFTLATPVNVRNYNTDFEIPGVLCENQSIEFRNTSMPAPTSSKWFINGQDVSYSITYAGALKTVFSTPGTYNIKLANYFGACYQELEKQVVIRKNPTVDGFISEIVSSCGSPWALNVKDTSSAAVAWRWNFNYYSWDNNFQYSTQNASYFYPYAGDYRVRLQITDAAGCTGDVVKTISLGAPDVKMVVLDANGWSGCDTLTKKFAAVSEETIVRYEWDFGDGSHSNEASPEHRFNGTGRHYNVRLTYTLANGCTGTRESQTITVYDPVKLDFEVQPEVCGNNWVHFNYKGTGGGGIVMWNYGDGSYSDGMGSHRYQQEGVYNVTLMMAAQGACGDTITKNSIIKVKGPFTRINSITNTCDGERNVVTFNDGTTDAEKWTWTFGDGSTTSYTSFQPSITHAYAESGFYYVQLTAEKDGCAVRLLADSVAYVTRKSRPVLSIDKPEVCINQLTDFHVRNLEPNLYILSDPMPRYSIKKWEYESGTPFTGSASPPSWYMDLDGTLSIADVKDDKIRLITTSYHFGCEDTTNYVPIRSKGVVPGFQVLNPDACFRSPLLFRDTSKASAGNAISSRLWDFGDGNQSTASGTVLHTFQQPGYYNVTLTVNDGTACNSTTNYATPVLVKGVKASFTVYPGTNVETGSVVSFYNNSNTAYSTGPVKYEWSFGDGAISTDMHASHTFGAAGVYTVRLIAIDEGIACRDTMIITISVNAEVIPVPHLVMNTITSFIGDNAACPPVKALFSYNINAGVNYDRVAWDFGDGSTVENQPNPSHIYTIAGTYIITLSMYNEGNLLSVVKDTIRFSLPPAAIKADDLSACIGETIKLYSPEENAGYTYTWDFGNGSVSNTADSLSTQAYITPGSYLPALIIRDVAGCAAAVKLDAAVVVHPDPQVTITPASPLVCKDASVQLQASGGVQYQWSPVNGLNNAQVADPIASPAVNTSYVVSVTDVNGCKGKASVNVEVAQPITMPAIAAADICKGSTVQLNASGAASYQWTGDLTELSNPQIANPVVKPEQTTSYTVVGFDRYKCYSDTVIVPVRVHNLPTVNAGDDREVVVGTSNPMQITNSADVVRWQWTPADYLSCTNCASPVSVPLAPVEYTVTVFTQYGCTVSDKVKLDVLCKDGNIYIPTAFTPNNDGKNDLFRIEGQGVTKIISLRIFNRWGEIIFEAKNFAPGGREGSWDGRLKGLPAETGTYVYFVEMECTAGMKFERKGVVTLVR